MNQEKQDLSWRPGDDYAIRLKAMTDEPLTKEQLNEMVEKVDELVKEYGFKTGSWGSLRGIVHVFGRS